MNICLFGTCLGKNKKNLLQAIGLQEARAASEAVAVGTPLLAVASLAVDVLVRAIAGNDGVESLGAVFALEALAMPHLQQNTKKLL